MIVSAFTWWAAATLLGLLMFPLAFRVFDRLPDRGIGFSRALGILAGGYIFWLGGSFQILENSPGGVVIVLLALAGVAYVAVRGRWGELGSWIRANRRLVLMEELVFLGAFLLWVFVRFNNPDITGTEKPMEIAFLNAILRSETFPPHDPWLSGYAISYYYFGYVLLGFLTRMTGSIASEAFNLGNSMWFALVAVGTYSLVHNLIRSTRSRVHLATPLLGPLFVLISGNLGGFLEVLHARHLFWAPSRSGELVSKFWTWIGLENLETPPFVEPNWMPTRHWWWWRASRVIRDRDLSGIPIGNQPIDEFPFFSFLLADNHPHLLAMPFVLLALAFALQVYLRGKRDGFLLSRVTLPPQTRDIVLGIAAAVLLGTAIASGVDAAEQGLSAMGAFISLIKSTLVTTIGLIFLAMLAGVLSGVLPSMLNRAELWFGMWLFGSLAFLNTWDFPIYLSLLILVLAWAGRWFGIKEMLRSVGITTIAVVTGSVILYLPWYPSFSSQAGGVLPHLFLPTRFLHFFIMFGVLLLPIVAWLGSRLANGWRKAELRRIILLAFGLPVVLLLVSWLLSALVGIAQYRSDPIGFQSMLNALGALGLSDGMVNTFWARLTGSWTALALGGIIACCSVILWRLLAPGEGDAESPPVTWHFVLFMTIIAALLVLGPEFYYLKDQFNVRMNTIFKFYFAAWILWGIAAAYALDAVWQKQGSRWRITQIIIILPLLMGLFYPVLSVWTRTEGFRPVNGQTLDGTRFMETYSPSDLRAIRWMNEKLDEGVLAEAVGGSFTYFGRISAHTGFPAVLGWPGHESQWRGGALEQGSRESDIRLLYQTSDWMLASEIIEKYGIDYIILGQTERSAYSPVFEQKFDAFLELLYENDGVKIYGRSDRGTS